jgi:hypothetical protein
MDSGSQADQPPERTSSRLANVFGTLIALLTLTLPIIAIAYFSSANADPTPPPSYPGYLRVRE